MFAPIGFTPATKLWDDYVAEHFPFVYDHATRYYCSKGFHAYSSRGSPIDVCEHLFLRALTNLGVHLSSSKGEVMKLHVRYDDHYPSLFQKIFPTNAAWQFAALDLNHDSGYDPTRVEGCSFDAWDADDGDNEAYRREYPPVKPGQKLEGYIRPYGNCKFHSLPIFYERENFRVVEKQPPWVANQTDPFMETNFIENFGGWSICALDTEIESSWKAHVNESLSEFSTESEIPVKRGRPELSDAKSFWESIKCEKGNRSWGQIQNILFTETGTKPSPRTLRDWRKAYLEKKSKETPGKKQGKNRE